MKIQLFMCVCVCMYAHACTGVHACVCTCISTCMYRLDADVGSSSVAVHLIF